MSMEDLIDVLERHPWKTFAVVAAVVIIRIGFLLVLGQ
jgi:hypothetical protein